MSALRVNQIRTKLRQLFEAHLDLSDISADDQQRDQKILTRCLAALAIYAQTACGAKEAAESVWDGADDNGIDAAFFDQSDLTVTFVQSKWINSGSGEPEAKELAPFLKGVKDAIENNITSFHPRLQAKLADIIQRLNTPGTKVHLVVATTGASTLSKHGTDSINALLKELNGGDLDPIATHEIMGLAEVYSTLASETQRGNLTIDAQILDWSKVTEPYPAYFGIIDGLQLKNWWASHGKKLVASNIRHALGTTEVNLEIKNSATAEPQNFWYFNNGITLVAEEALKAPANAASRSAGVFTFKGASIVNGAQTVSTLGKVENDDALGKVKVPIRVILLKTTPAGFGQQVTRTNNLQNRVEPRDFVAQDPQQNRIRQEMAIEGVEYQFVRSDETNATPNSCELIEVTTALACASGDSNLAVQLKTGIGRFFNDLQKAPYRAVFNPSVSGAYAFNATVTLRSIEAWIEAKKKTIARKSGATWGVLVHGNRILAAAVFKSLGKNDLLKPIQDFAGTLDKARVDAECEKAYEKMVAIIEKDYQSKFLAVLFKNPSASKIVFEEAIR